MIVSFTAFSWLAMMAVHELGHVLGPSFGFGPARGRVQRGATVASVVLLGLTVLAELLFLRG